jgi:protein-tyrosine-phosphatase/tRNA A37 threonylcarbamoyladenosine synthetase subunit TsaC/SUA5/YrdC
MAEVLDWQQTAKAQVIQRAARTLSAGGLVAFPTETAYALAASGLCPEAVAQLDSWPAAEGRGSLQVAVRDAAAALDWVPSMSSLGRRLARRCWPGPVELVWGEEARQGLVRRLPAPVRAQVCAAGNLGLRIPGHRAILQLLQSFAGPVVLRTIPAPESGPESGETSPEAVTPEQVVQALGEREALVLADGPSRYGRPATAVRVTGNTWELLREGIVTRETLGRLSGCMILFICTGNTCRSPMAEALCKKLLADRLSCSPEELPERGFVVQSAGLSAMMGSGAAEEALATAQEFGADLSDHSSQPVSADLVAQADHLIAMTQTHLQLLTRHFPRLGTRPRLLSPEGHDLPDPIGGSLAVYRDCAQVILRHLEHFLPEVYQP